MSYSICVRNDVGVDYSMFVKFGCSHGTFSSMVLLRLGSDFIKSIKRARYMA